ncbi:hypothetical protein ORI20_25715 [Mycobacterium sp. CVI_P3]|uniref:Uncharacterized protein n=1 Tax=Mycobacterium pinniadriaticum TaxID=2994102 RepID=A0ABT3SKI4_9MYCO|nr:hypothetical protein [Mycobacterium pinniadriaticum]MCX2933673.1 hypothetical protein [Mycobacterium pinniadriaticum]MCX2940040.1 hypothetical protein [Mycobacterium pinniadriaticum]
MTDRDSFPDDVPIADIVEQNRSAAGAADADDVDGDDSALIDDALPPLESDESDWQEQHQVIEDPDPDELR